MEHDAWLQHIKGEDSLRAAARKINVSPSTITRQIERNGTLSPETVIDLARAYGANPIDALVETGYIYLSEQRESGSPVTLGYATNEQILEEMMRRVDPQAVRLFHGDEDTITPKFPATVHNLPAHDEPLADWDDTQPYAADGSEEEGGNPDDYIP